MATVSQLQEKKPMTIGSLNRKPKPNFTYNNNLLENVNEFKFALNVALSCALYVSIFQISQL
jgi:hypothetical protein